MTKAMYNKVLKISSVLLCFVCMSGCNAKNANNLSTEQGKIPFPTSEEISISESSSEEMEPISTESDLSTYETVPIEGFPQPMKIYELMNGDYIFAPCHELPEPDSTPPKRGETYTDDSLEIAVKPNKPVCKTGSYLPGDCDVAEDVLTGFDFGGYSENLIITENAEYSVEANKKIEIEVHNYAFAWEPVEVELELGLCNLDTKQCYCYEALQDRDASKNLKTVYPFTDLPEGNYRFYVKHTGRASLPYGYIRFRVMVR